MVTKTVTWTAVSLRLRAFSYLVPDGEALCLRPPNCRALTPETVYYVFPLRTSPGPSVARGCSDLVTLPWPARYVPPPRLCRGHLSPKGPPWWTQHLGVFNPSKVQTAREPW